MKQKVPPLKWHIDNRIDYLQKRQSKLRKLALESEPSSAIDALLEFAENSGRLKELRQILERLDNGFMDIKL